MRDIVRNKGLMLPTEKDMQKPVFKKYWNPQPAEEQDMPRRSRIDVSKFNVLEDMLQKRMSSADPPPRPVPAVRGTVLAAQQQAQAQAERPIPHKRTIFMKEAVAPPVPPPKPAHSAERPPSHTRDGFCDSEYVFGLNKCNFHQFIADKDISLVFFYRDPFEIETRWVKQQLNKAARSTRRENHAFSAVNCYEECQLCASLKVGNCPMFKFFSKGRTVSTLQDLRTLSADIIKKIVENLPSF